MSNKTTSNISIWTAEIIGSVNGFILNYVDRVTEAGMKEKYYDSIIESIIKIGKENIPGFIYYNTEYNGAYSIYIQFRFIGNYSPRYFQDLLPSYGEKQVKKMGINERDIKIMIMMDLEYDIETNIWFHPILGIFRLRGDRPAVRDEYVPESFKNNRYIGNMKHLDEYNSFSLDKLKPSFFRKGKGRSMFLPSAKGNIIMLHCELNDAKILAVVDFVEFLSTLGVKGNVDKTPLEEEDYEVKIDTPISIEEIEKSIPEEPIGDSAMSTSPITIWYKGDDENKLTFMWGWGKGIYKGIGDGTY